MRYRILLFVILVFVMTSTAHAQTERPTPPPVERWLVSLPLVWNAVFSAIVEPAPGAYDLNQFMSINISAPGCEFVGVDFGPTVQAQAYQVYHLECIEGKALMLISFYKPVEFDHVNLTAFYPGNRQRHRYVYGEWSFGYPLPY